ncbi:pfs domain-containing protein [Colletotrichum salicis]|uniref:Pfs domain-containing protein n=1 Tax=Colletotrichum salicis TaxID=1209931 RepID=A0A135TR12_9PEZI|nr:pfs domain-containing protein [Colletotrichum salicis]
MSDPSLYTIGWICAIVPEFVAARLFLDEAHEELRSQFKNDNNSYKLGRMGKLNVAIAVLPHGEYGESSAAVVARDMIRTFENIRVGLMAGIGGGAPGPEKDIRLGDVVVSSPTGGYDGVLQYDFGKSMVDGKLEMTGFLNQPPIALRTALNVLITDIEIEGNWLENDIKKALKTEHLRQKYGRPSSEFDKLFRSDISYDPNKTMAHYTTSDFVERQERSPDSTLQPSQKLWSVAFLTRALRSNSVKSVGAEVNAIKDYIDHDTFVQQRPELSPYVVEAIKKTDDISSRRLEEQFSKLILDPLNEVGSKARGFKNLILILEALDECSDEKYVKALLNLLLKVVDSDAKFPAEQLAVGLPGNEKINALVKIAIPLFLFTAIACRFIRDDVFGRPEEQLLKLIQIAKEGNVQDKLGETYRPVLKQFQGNRTKHEQLLLSKRFRKVIGTIILLEQPFAIGSIAGLLGLQISEVHGILNPLKSTSYDCKRRFGNTAAAVYFLKINFSIGSKLLAFLEKRIVVFSPEQSKSRDDVGQVDVSQDSEKIAVSCSHYIYEHTAAIWTISTRDHLELLPVHPYNCPDDSDLRAMDAFYEDKSGMLAKLRSKPKGGSFICFSPNSQFVATSSDFGGVDLWEVSTGQYVRTFPTNRPLVGPLAFVSGTSFLMISEAEGVRTLDIDTGYWTSRVPGGGNTLGAVAISHDARFIAHDRIADSDTISISLFDTGEPYKSLDLTSIFNAKSLRSTSWAAAFSPDGKYLVVTKCDGVAIWSLSMIQRSRSVVKETDPSTKPEFLPTGSCFIHRGASQEAARIVSMDEGSNSREVRIWSSDTGQLFQTVVNDGDVLGLWGYLLIP